MMWNAGYLAPECDHQWVDTNIKRRQDLDKFLDPEKTEAYMVNDQAVLRQMGWSFEGDSFCESCGLAEMGAQFPICGECENCRECGCDDECSNK
jgi:hypothetical protein